MPTRCDWLLKLRFMLLMNKVLAVNSYRHRNENALSTFEKKWYEFLSYWNKVKPTQFVKDEVLIYCK